MAVIKRSKALQCPDHPTATQVFRQGWRCCECDGKPVEVEVVTVRADDWQGAVETRDDYAKTLHRIAYPGNYEGSGEWSRSMAFAALKRHAGGQSDQ